MMRTRVGLLVPLLAVGTWVAWSWGEPRGAHRAAAPPADEAAEAAQAEDVSPQTLIVDFKDDVSDAALASNPYLEEPISHYSAVDRLYRVRFGSAEAAARAAAALRNDP